MKNKDLIIKVARRLDKFNLDEIIVVSELQEQEVKEILSDLIKEQVIIKSSNKYFFYNKRNNEQNETLSTKNNTLKPIILEEEEGYEELLKYNEDVQNKIKRYVAAINFVINAGKGNLKRVVELFNETSGLKRVPYSILVKLLHNYKMYGFKGILPKYHNHGESPIPDELYTCFKNFYLTKEKLSAKEALYRAQKLLHDEQKIEQPYTYNLNSFTRKIKTDFTEEQIKYFRNNVKPLKAKISNDENDEPLDMEFKNAARIYLNRLKIENKQERLLHEKTDYKNHLKEYFDNLTIREITPKVVAKYKQSMFDKGFKLVSVNQYILLLKAIIRGVCPKINNLVTREDKDRRNAYALDMNILTEDEILKLLNICKLKYPEAYPIIYISLSTGASVPELLGLTWDRVDFEENTIFLKYFLYDERLITNRSGTSKRKLKIDKRMTEILKEKYKATKPLPADFVFRFSSPKLPQQYFENVVLNGLSKKLRIQRIYPSDLQHNFTNLCLKQKIPFTFIQKSLGYFGIINFVKIYRNLIEQSEEKYYNPLENLKLLK